MTWHNVPAPEFKNLIGAWFSSEVSCAIRVANLPTGCLLVTICNDSNPQSSQSTNTIFLDKLEWDGKNFKNLE